MFHAPKSPSKASQFIGCPGSLSFCDTLPAELRNVSSDAALLGTASHGLVEESLRKLIHPEKYEGRIIELIGDEQKISILRNGAKAPKQTGRIWFEVDSSMIESAAVPYGYVLERCTELEIDPKTLQLETRTNPLPDREDTSGTADVTIDAWPSILEVVDFKNGFMYVHHEDNDQLRAYLLGKAIEAEWSHENYAVTVIQPNAPSAEGIIRTSTYTREELQEFAKYYRKGVEKCDKAAAAFDKAVGFELFTDGDMDGDAFKKWEMTWLLAGKHCYWCQRAATCPTRRRFAETEAALDFAEPSKELVLKQSEERVAVILNWADNLENLIKQARDYAKRAILAGYEVPGWKLVHGKSRRTFVDLPEKKLVAAILKGKFLKAKELFPQPKMISGPAAEKLVPRKKRKQFAERFLVKPEGGLTLAPEDDPREAVEEGAAIDFAEEGDGET